MTFKKKTEYVFCFFVFNSAEVQRHLKFIIILHSSELSLQNVLIGQNV